MNRHSIVFGAFVLLGLAPLALADAALADAALADDASAQADPAPVAAEDIAAEGDVSDRARATYAFSRAKLLADSGRLVEAAESFDEALRLDPDDPYAHTEAAKFHLYLAQISRRPAQRTSHLERAAELAAAGRELAPQNADTLRIFGDIHMRMAEMRPDALAKAQEAFQVLAEDDDLQALTSLAQIALWQRDGEQAVKILRRASNLAPNHRMIQNMLVEALMSAGDTERAIPELETLLELDPDHMEARVRLAEIYSDQGRHARAVELLRAAPDELADRFRLRQLLSRELHLAGRHREALALSDELLADEPRAPGFYRLRMSILASLARYEEAIEILDPAGSGIAVNRGQSRDGDGTSSTGGVPTAATAEAPIRLIAPAAQRPERHVQDVLLLARLEERAGRSETAAQRIESLLERLRATDGAFADLDAETRRQQEAKLRLSLAGVLQRLGRADEAATWIEPLLAGAAGERLALYSQSLAEVWIDAGDVERAMELLDMAAERLVADGQAGVADALRLRQVLDLAELERWPAVLERLDGLAAAEAPEIRQAGRQLRAEALAGTGQVAEAVEALATGDEPPELRAKRLQLLLEHGREDEALAELETLAASGEPDDLLFVARVLQSEDRHARAVPLLRDLARERPDSVQILFMLGAALERAGDHAAAVDAFERLLALEPSHAPSLNYLGYMWAERAENLDRALDLILRAVAQEPDNGAYVDSLGWAYYQLGRYDEARQHLEWAARLVDDDPTIHHHLGDVYRALERPAEARASYRRALELSGPENAGELDAVDRADLERKLEELNRSGP